ncbi:ATPase domain-containing protein [Halobacterium sp. NMX12-1]|jgi:KaiC/GvpD/RAD55 family RecA-like ATPase|uniref:ATPase domain-containing protein n=1 Tax=Halobacterium sp. NMX12-1 TaxID=3166650 RepID=A0AAU8CBU9_9EURY
MSGIEERVSTGIDGLDAVLHGGLERGTVSVISGPSGAGKTTTGTQFVNRLGAKPRGLSVDSRSIRARRKACNRHSRSASLT